MARTAAQVVENNFVRALITEATGLNYPENSCVDTWDCYFDFFGRVERRPGFDFEFGYQTAAIPKAGCAINTYLWKNVTGDGIVSLVVMQVGSTLYFYNAVNIAQLSGSLLTSSVDLTVYSPSGAPSPNIYDCQFTDGLSRLYVTHPYLNNFYVTYDQNSNTVTATGYTLMMRDFEGQLVQDPYAIDQRPSYPGVDNYHIYNLYNQGWVAADLSTWVNGQSANTNQGLLAVSGRSDYPSNCDVDWEFQNALNFFDLSTIPTIDNGNSPAPNGHFVIPVYASNRNTLTPETGLTETTSNGACTSTCAFHAGRVFYAGVNADGYTSKIYFTQIIERNDQLGSCYQVCDPTSQNLFDLLPADGGVISIPEAGTIYKLFSTAMGLLVFAYRGVWIITGNVGIGFTANDFSVMNISGIRTVSATSFVNCNGVPIWWNTDGIFTVQGGNPASGAQPQVQSMSISTIQTFFNDIPNSSKTTARGYFNPVAQVVQWLYNTNEPQTIDDQYTFNAVLNYDVLTGSFYPWSIAQSTDPTNPTVHSIMVIDGVGGTPQQSMIVDGSNNQIVDSLGDTVVGYELTNTQILPKTKFLTTYNNSGTNVFTWSEADNEDYVDWEALGLNVDYTSYFISGYKIHGKAQEKFQPTYVYVFNEGTGQCYIQGIWDFSLTGNTGRYSTKQLLTYDDANYSNSYKRVKIRGQGLTLQYYVQSISGQPFCLVGWSTFETGNTQP